MLVIVTVEPNQPNWLERVPPPKKKIGHLVSHLAGRMDGVALKSASFQVALLRTESRTVPLA